MSEWSELVDVLPEPMTCGRRAESGMDMVSSLRGSGPNLDRWEKHKRNGDRVCSYCGSLHPDDFFRLVKAAAEASEDAIDCVDVEQSDKRYKIYVRQTDVRNAHEGGIKFYTAHLPEEVTDEQNTLFMLAVRRSRTRFQKRMAARFPKNNGDEHG